jgi:small GTP-binding protein
MMSKIIKNKVLKIVIAGDGATGKTTISKRLSGKLNNNENISMTFGIDFHTLEITNHEGNAVIWDLGGQEQFRVFQPDFFKEADIVILVFSVDWFPTFMNIDSWLGMINKYDAGKIYLIANKIDIENRAVNKDEIEEFAKDNDLILFQISALTGKNFMDFENHLMETSIKLVNDRKGKNGGKKPKTSNNSQVKLNQSEIGTRLERESVSEN